MKFTLGKTLSYKAEEKTIAVISDEKEAKSIDADDKKRNNEGIVSKSTSARITELGEETDGPHRQTIIKVNLAGKTPVVGGALINRDLSLSVGKEGRLINDKNSFLTSFAKDTSENSILTIENKGDFISLRAEGLEKRNAETEKSGSKGSSLIYKDIRDGVDLRYKLTTRGVKEEFIIRKKQDSYAFESFLDIGNLKPEYDEGSKTLVLKNGSETRFRILPPVMSDAGGRTSDKCSYDIEEKEEKTLSVVLRADKEWIDSPERKLPITIDPSIEVPEEGVITLEQHRDGFLVPNLDSGFVFGVRRADDETHEHSLRIVVDADMVNNRITEHNKLSKMTVNIPFRINKTTNGNGIASDGHYFMQAISDEGEVIQKFGTSGSNNFVSLDLAKWILGKKGSHYVELIHGYSSLRVENPEPSLPPIESPIKKPGVGGSIGFSASEISSYSKMPKIVSGTSYPDGRSLMRNSVFSSGFRPITPALPEHGSGSGGSEDGDSDGSQTDSEPTGYYIETYPLSDMNAPSAKIVFQLDLVEDWKGPSKTVTLSGGMGRSLVNLSTGNLIHSFPGLTVSSKFLSVPIDIVYDHRIAVQNNGDDFIKHMGVGWKTSLHQYLVKVNEADSETFSRDVAYIDGNGDTHIFKERWFYDDYSGNRHYVDREDIYLDNDGKVKWDDDEGGPHELSHEAVNQEGLTFVSGMNLSSFKRKPRVRKKYYAVLGDGARMEFDGTSDQWHLQFCYYDENGSLVDVYPDNVLPGENGTFIYGPYVLFIDTSFNSRPGYAEDYFIYRIGEKIHTDGRVEMEDSVEYVPEPDELFVNDDISKVNSSLLQIERAIYDARDSINECRSAIRALFFQTKTAMLSAERQLKVFSISKTLQSRQDVLSQKQKTFIDSYVGKNVFWNAIGEVSKDKDFHFDPNTYEVTTYANYDGDDYEGLISVYNYAVSYDSLMIQSLSLKDQVNMAENNGLITIDGVRNGLASLTAQYIQQRSRLISLQENLNNLYSERNELTLKKNLLVEQQKSKVNDFIVDKEGNTLGFDGYGRLVLVEDKEGNKVSIEYESLKNPLYVASYDVVTEKDARILSVSSDTEKVVFAYDGPDRRLESMSDGSGRRVSFGYDGGQLSYLILPDGRKVNFAEGGLSVIDDLLSKAEFSIGDNGKVSGFMCGHSDVTVSGKEGLTQGDKVLFKDSDLSFIYGDGRTSIKNNMDADKDTELIFDEDGNLVEENGQDASSVNLFDDGRLLFSGSYDSKEKYVLKDQAAGLSKLDVSALADANKLTLPSSFMVGLVVNSGSAASSADMRITLEGNSGSIIRDSSITFSAESGRKYLLPLRMKKGEGTLALSVGDGWSVTDSKLVLLSDGIVRKYLKAHDGIYDVVSEENAESYTEYGNFSGHTPLSKTVVDYSNPDHDVTTSLSFNSDGHVAHIEDSDGNVEEHFYDEKGNETEARSFNRSDAALVRISKKSSNENKNTDVYSISSKVDGGNDESSNSHDHNEGHNSMASSLFDSMSGNLLGIVNASDGISNHTSFSYKNGLLTGISNHGVNFSYDYDGLGRKKAVYMNGKLRNSFSYADDYSNTTLGIDHGKLVNASVTDENGGSTETILDKYGRERQVSVRAKDTTQTITTKYDQVERDRKTEVLSILTKGGQSIEEKVSYGYDNDRLNFTEKTMDGLSVVKKTYEYDSLGRLGDLTTSIGTMDGKKIIERYSYDRLGNVSSISIQDGIITADVRRDALGRIDSMSVDMREGTSIRNEYEYMIRDGSSSDMVAEHVQRVGDSADVYDYLYDNFGNITFVESEDGETRYRYDSLSRLVREDNQILGKSFVYKYDSGGNILLKKTYAYSIDETLSSPERSEYSYDSRGWRDQLVSFGGRSIRYDSLGRPVDYMGVSMTWDDRGLLSALDPDGSGTASPVSYGYDANGIRISKKFSDTRHTEYVVDGTRILGMKVTNGDSIRNILFTYANGYLLGFSVDDVQYLYTRNIQGDVTGIYKADGTMVCRYYYDAYGTQKVVKADNNSDIADINPFRYRGYFFDIESGLYYLNARYYDPRTGRFISPDDTSILDQTKSEINGLNLYIYCGGNPVMRTDPTGRDWWSDLWNKFQTGVVTLFVSALAVLAIGAISVFTFGLGAVLTVGLGALAGGLISFGVSTGMQLASNGWNFNKLDWNTILIDTGFGMVGGAIGGTAIGKIGQLAVGSLLNAANTIEDGIVSGTDIALIQLQVLVGFGINLVGFKRFGGSGALREFAKDTGLGLKNPAAKNLVQFSLASYAFKKLYKIPYLTQTPLDTLFDSLFETGRGVLFA